jgi:purine-nucleoside phosphorylase
MNSSHSTSADRVAAAAESIRRRWPSAAKTAVILGTGLGELADEVQAATAIPYCEIPGFPRSTALAHKGRLVCGELQGRPVIVLQGRCHLYEGYQLDELTLPVRVLAALGVQTLIVTNAAGGVNPNYAIGDVMLIEDHIDLMFTRDRRPACHAVSDSILDWQARRVPGGGYYSRKLAAAAEQAARAADFPLRRGVYVAVTGPSYETRAEYRAFRRLGGDAVGMSTVPEVLTATALGLSVLGLSTITNVARPDAPATVSAEEVVAVAAIARPRVRALIERTVSIAAGD